MNGEATAPKLPATSYAVLGLLSFKEMSGYDVKQHADGSIRYFFWSPASSQIYSELRRLASLGYVRERRVAQERRPDKRLYRITRTGEQALRAWLEDSQPVPDVHKSLQLLKLFFGQSTSPGVLTEQLAERRRHTRQALAEFEEIERLLADQEQGFYAHLTLQSSLAHTHAELVWLDYAIEELSRRSSS